jgi:hypothetical protein
VNSIMTDLSLLTEGIKVKRIIVILSVLFIVNSACGQLSSPTEQLKSTLVEIVPTEPVSPSPTFASVLPTFTQPPAEVLPTATTEPTASPTSLPSDITFSIDCSALDPSRKADCDVFIAKTRDIVYPVLREITGVSLGSCYSNLHYVILPGNPSAGAGGVSQGSTIQYDQKYSIDLIPPMDVHEIFHSFSTCNKALDQHIFHIMVLNAVYDTLGIHTQGYFVSRDAEDLNQNLDFLLGKIGTADKSELIGICRGIINRKMGIAYFDLGKGAIATLYKSTIDPVKLGNPPSKILISIWGSKDAEKVQALLESLQRNYKYSLNVPACGY